MANLFVVFTPLQVVIAQQIIRQEKLSDNVMLESSLPNFLHFLNIYEVLLIQEMWTKEILFDQWPCWDNGGVNILGDAIKTKQKAKEIKRILVSNNIDTIYLADYQCQTNRFTCVWLRSMGYKVVFYEEGYSHYIPRPASPPPQNLLHKVYEWILDVFYYQPFYHVNFAKWRCYPNKDYHGLPISARYSIIPDIHHEPYDKLLKCEPMVSPKLQTYINEELDKYDENKDEKKILLLTDPMTEVLRPQYRYLYFETISESLDNYRDYCVVVKFHPRDNEKDRDRIIKMIEGKGLKYIVLGQRINIPIELYLQNCHFEEILFFNTSTYFYNGYLFPKTKFVKQLPLLYQKCLKTKVTGLKQMESLIQFMG